MITNASKIQRASKLPQTSAPLRQIVAIYLPDLPVQHLSLSEGWDSDMPIALYETVKGSQILKYVSASARTAGLVTSMRLTDARALLPSTRFRQFELDKTKSWLKSIGWWAWRYSPVVGIDADSLTLWIDMTGARHFFDNDEDLAAQLVSDFQKADLTAHIALAPTYGAAFALAHFKAQAGMPVICSAERKALIDTVSDLPVSALRIAPIVVSGLIKSGLSTIGALSAISRSALHVRFGAEIVLRRDQMLAHADEVLTPLVWQAPVMITRSFYEPLAGLVPMQEMVRQLVDGMADLLTEKQWLTRQLEIGWQRVDGSIGRRWFRLSRPRRERQLLHRLTERLAEEIDAEFGVEYAWISAQKLSEGLPQTLQLDGREQAADSLQQLIDHLGARLGSDKIRRLTPYPDWQPEASMRVIAADIDSDSYSWEIPEAEALSAPRPVRLLSPAREVSAIALLPDHPPGQIRSKSQTWQIINASGPERIGPRWWDVDAGKYISRDYYRLETETGARLWVYREGLPERGEAMRWFLHGYFA